MRTAGTLGKRIKALRKKERLTQADLAKELGVSPSAVGMYEQDRRVPDNKTLLTICNVFGVTSDYLLGHMEDPEDVSDVLDTFNKRLMEHDALMMRQYGNHHFIFGTARTCQRVYNEKPWKMVYRSQQYA